MNLVTQLPVRRIMIALAVTGLAAVGAFALAPSSPATPTVHVIQSGAIAPTPVPAPAPEPTTTTTAPQPVPAPVAPRKATVAATPVPTPIPAPPSMGGGIQPGHWTQSTNGAIYRDPSPDTTPQVGNGDAAYEQGLNARLCAVKPWDC